MLQRPTGIPLKPMLLLAFAYALFGWGAVQIAIPGGIAAPFFPSAGLALAALLIWGRGLWPGVLMGALLLQVVVIQMLPLASWSFSPIVIPIATTLQALAGAALAQRLVGFPNGLDTPRSVIRLLAVVAPVSCLVCASAAVSILVASGVLPVERAWFSWWNWWTGDTLGVMVTAPIVFVLFAQPRQDWSGRVRAIVLPMLGALILLTLAFAQVRDWESQRLQDRFNRDAEHVANLVRDRLRTHFEMLQSLERLMTVSEDVQWADYRDFVHPWLERYPGIQNFGWSPLVNREGRAAFEARIRASGRPDFVILARDADGTTHPSPELAEYLPITYVEPLAGNERVIGLNPLSLPNTAKPILRSRASGQPSASEAIHLVQEQGRQRAVVVYQWVVGRDEHASVGPGVLSAVFRMDDVIAAALSVIEDRAVDLCMVDLDGTDNNRRLSGAPGCEQEDWLDNHTSALLPMTFADHQWWIKLRATPRYLSEQAGWAGWTTIAVGGLASGILGAFLLVTSGRTRRVEAQVFRRTAQLSASQDRVRRQQNALAQAQRMARIGSWEWNPGSEELTRSRELQRMLITESGRPLRTLEDLLECVHADDRPHLALALEEARNGVAASLDCHLISSVTEPRIARFAIEPDATVRPLAGLRGTVQDITAARQAQEHIHYLAHYDPLTGLPNRLLWYNRTDGAIAVAKRHDHQLAVLFLDLDQFKHVNDSLGHAIGDRLLTGVATRLKAGLREEDVLARLGGDEFVLLLPQLEDAEDASRVAMHVLKSLSRPFHVDGHELSVSVSIGIASYPADGKDVATLLQHADTAMYAAKEAGRNNYQFFTPEMNARTMQRLMLENALRRSIERNELLLEYQPQVEAGSGCLVGCEALVRWRHPELGLIPPIQFIPVAEAGGFIATLGAWILHEACRQQVRWRERTGPGFTVAINISALQFQRKDFVEEVAHALEETGADPAGIELELTESALALPTDELLSRMGALRDMGLSLALDDFGTGYSCLAYLKRLPIARLKLDRSFVKDLPDDSEDAAIANATLSIARDLGLDVVAEGVETDAQRSFLAERGCAYLQGYLFGRPMSPEAFSAGFLDNPLPPPASSAAPAPRLAPENPG